MRTRIKRLTAIGSAIGLVLMASAITPAVAAPVPTAFTATGCSSFQGATTTGYKVGFTGVALRGGDTITASVSPASAGDTIAFSTSLGLNIIVGGGEPSGYTFQVPADGYYNLTWSLKTSSTTSTTPTWSFTATCSSTTVSPSPTPTTAPTKPGKGGGKGKGK